MTRRASMIRSLAPAVHSALEGIMRDVCALRVEISAREREGFDESEFASIRASLHMYVARSVRLVGSLGTFGTEQQEGVSRASMLDESIQATARDCMMALRLHAPSPVNVTPIRIRYAGMSIGGNSFPATPKNQQRNPIRVRKTVTLKKIH